MQPVRRRAVRRRLPDRGDVQAPRRDRRLRQAGLHRLQGLHGGVPVRRDLHQSRGSLGGEVQPLRPSAGRRSRAGVRRRLSGRGDPGRRPERSRHRRWRRSCSGTPSPFGRPEKQTRPRLFYRGAHPATLDPLAARRPEGGLFMWSEQPAGGGTVVSGHPRSGASMAAAIVSVRRPAPGAVGLAGQSLHLDEGNRRRRLSRSPRPRAGGAARVVELALAPRGAVRRPRLPGGDRGDPDRRSRAPAPLSRSSSCDRSGGAGSSAGRGGDHGVRRSCSGSPWCCRPRLRRGLRNGLRSRAIRSAVAAAVYTGYLFAQAKGRDLWQSRLLPLAPARPGHAPRRRRDAAVRPLARRRRGRRDRVDGLRRPALAHLGARRARSDASPHPTAHARLADARARSRTISPWCSGRAPSSSPWPHSLR